jgi:hypothetical protein
MPQSLIPHFMNPQTLELIYKCLLSSLNSPQRNSYFETSTIKCYLSHSKIWKVGEFPQETQTNVLIQQHI